MCKYLFPNRAVNQVPFFEDYFWSVVAEKIKVIRAEAPSFQWVYSICFLL